MEMPEIVDEVFVPINSDRKPVSFDIRNGTLIHDILDPDLAMHIDACLIILRSMTEDDSACGGDVL